MMECAELRPHPYFPASEIDVSLDDHEIVTITYRGGGTHTVNVHMDSYAAIVREVSQHIT